MIPSPLLRICFPPQVEKISLREREKVYVSPPSSGAAVKNFFFSCKEAPLFVEYNGYTFRLLPLRKTSCCQEDGGDAFLPPLFPQTREAVPRRRFSTCRRCFPLFHPHLAPDRQSFFPCKKRPRDEKSCFFSGPPPQPPPPPL